MSASAEHDARDLLHRRWFLSAAAGALASPLLPDRALAAAVHTFQQGAFKIRLFSDGHMIVPASMLAIGAPPERLAEVLRRTNAPAPTSERTKILGFHFKYPGIGYAEAAGSNFRFASA